MLEYLTLNVMMVLILKDKACFIWYIYFFWKRWEEIIPIFLW